MKENEKNSKTTKKKTVTSKKTSLKSSTKDNNKTNVKKTSTKSKNSKSSTKKTSPKTSVTPKRKESVNKTLQTDLEKKLKSNNSIPLNNEQYFIEDSNVVVSKVTLKTLEEQQKDEEAKIASQIYSKQKRRRIYEPVIAIILLGICFYLCYYFLISSPRAKVNNVINVLFNSANELLTTIDLANNKSYYTKINARYDTTNEDMMYLKKYDYEINYAYDKNQNEMYGNIALINTYDNNPLTILFKKQRERLYLNSSKLYYYPIFVKLNSDYSLSIDNSLLKSSLTNIKDIALNKIELGQRVKQKEIISINNQDIQTNKLEITYDSIEVNKILNEIRLDILQNDILLKDLSNALNLDVNSIKEFLENSIKLDFQSLKFNIFTKGFLQDIVGLSISIDDNELIKVIRYNHDYILKLKSTNEEIYLTYYNNKNLELSYGKVKILSLDINKNDHQIQLDYRANMITDKYNGSIIIDKYSPSEYHLDLSYVKEKDANINGNLDINISLSENLPNSLITIEDAVELNDLSVEDKQAIFEKILSYLNFNT